MQVNVFEDDGQLNYQIGPTYMYASLTTIGTGLCHCVLN